MKPTHIQYRYPLFYELPTSLKVLFTNVLVMMGFGYVFGLTQIWEVHHLEDGKPGLSVHDIQIAYRGNRTGTRLESALRGSMSGNIAPDQAEKIFKWIHAGATEKGYNEEVKPIFDERCIGCHNGHMGGIPDLRDYAGISETIKLDKGVSVGTLVRVSHIHLFGLTLIFTIIGFIFSHAYIKWRHVKSLIILVPFLAIFVDIASWWLTKVSAAFGYTVIIGGALMGVAFALQWAISMYQMWFFHPDVGEKHVPD